MPVNSDLQKLAALVEELAQRHNWPPETVQDVADVLYGARKAMSEISYEEWVEYWKEKK